MKALNKFFPALALGSALTLSNLAVAQDDAAAAAEPPPPDPREVAAENLNQLLEFVQQGAVTEQSANREREARFHPRQSRVLGVFGLNSRQTVPEDLIVEDESALHSNYHHHDDDASWSVQTSRSWMMNSSDGVFCFPSRNPHWMLTTMSILTCQNFWKHSSFHSKQPVLV